MRSRDFVEGVDFTVEDGRVVLTGHFLLRRGACCNSRCKNCPYREKSDTKETQEVKVET